MSRPARLPHPLAALPAVALATLLVHGCNKLPIQPLIPNQPPSVRFTLAPVSADPNDPVFYAYKVFWAGDDPDGRVDHFEYAIDPAPGDTVWVHTPRAEETLFFRSTTPDGIRGPVPHATDYHILTLRAVDNQGALSPVKTRAFYSYTVAPSVEIVAPHPNAFIEEKVPPTLTLTWHGEDPDGVIHTRPVKYLFRLLPVDPVFDVWMLSDPDSLYRREKAAGFADWDTTSGDTTTARYTNLAPQSHYLFLLLAVDEAGAMSPLLSLDENVLRVAVDLAATLGPYIHIFNEYLDYAYASGGYTVDPLRWILLDAPADRPINFNWDAIATAGASIERYRWGVDFQSVSDETPRQDEALDYFHWSRGGPLEQSCRLVGLKPGDHFLYIEAKDNNGFASLGIVKFTLVPATLDHELLIVNDTRRELDKPSADSSCVETYKDFWPSATELDTFLFARGGVPWRCTQQRPPDLRSPPGVFAGYPFDKIGTRPIPENPALGVRLRDLLKYRHVVWMLDGLAATYFDLAEPKPVSVLGFSSGRGQSSALAAYVQAGGQVWLMGGGAGTATTDAFNSKRNDEIRRIYSSSELELTHGRIMFDGAHWQSAFTTAQGFVRVTRSPAADAIADRPWSHRDRWSGGELHAPDYRRLPPELRPRDPATDPIPPTRRTTQNSSLYYLDTYFSTEFLLEPNLITEDVDPGDDVKFAQTLDTLYDASGTLMRRSPAPVMTFYHGADANRFVFSGFAPWDFHRDDVIALSDFVLQDLWGIQRQAVERSPAGVAGVAGTRARPVAPPVIRLRGTTRARAVYR